MAKNFDKLATELRKNSAVREAYDAMEEEFGIASALIEARAKAGLTQGELAKRMGTTQSAIARIESGKHWPSRKTLEGYAKATGMRPTIRFVEAG
ncbi:MAG: XRE family transcriptional regulator [Alphaproteobacteria bacterium]|nr:MAG: XRE family transcriptional regulator [Alphaproteobacteria bacterium]